MEKESPRHRLVEANCIGGQGSRRAVESGGGGAKAINITYLSVCACVRAGTRANVRERMCM